eukprot:gnl/TRDRNA2_/TRDRNA2_140463_c2_seq1.p1 gnl/TRDRNA2_/TRDRNA2_140463_c2~~gnl/TRDRNA2_/TRDRNA2_140463_c2_seq1.p1  ORF type:complete len:588 (-),score=92.97 gnl/TRDRNA2_/TRDRNA2_140463_c2_seq1:123-1649(-)
MTVPAWLASPQGSMVPLPGFLADEMADSPVGSSPRSADAEQIVHKLHEGEPVDSEMLNNIVHAYTKRGDIDGVEEWMETMRLHHGVKFSLKAYHAVLHACAHNGLGSRAERCLLRMQEADCLPNEQTYMVVIYAFCRADDIEGAERWLTAFLKNPSSYNPNLVTQMVNMVIHACSRAGDIERAEYWLTELIKLGLKPTQVTFGAILNVCAEVGDLSKTEHFCQIMERFGLEGNHVSYNTQIKACSQKGDIQRAEALLMRMQREGLEMSVITYNSMIHTCAQAGDIKRAEQYMIRMEQAGLKPNQITYNSVINACAKHGDAVRAEAWLVRMLKNNISPNEVTYGTICKAYAHEGNEKAVGEIMQALRTTGHSPNEYFYASFLTACGNAKPPKPERAEAAFHEMVALNMKPDMVSRVLRNVLGEARADDLLNSVAVNQGCKNRGRGQKGGTSGRAQQPQGCDGRRLGAQEKPKLTDEFAKCSVGRRYRTRGGPNTTSVGGSLGHYQSYRL